MTTEQAKKLSEDALTRLMTALEQGHSEALQAYLARDVPLSQVQLGQRSFDLQPAARCHARGGFQCLAQAPAAASAKARRAS